MSFGALPDNWFNFELLGLTADLLPVVSNPAGTVSPNSKLKDLGKVPSRYNHDGHIVGIANWTQKHSTAKEVEKWSQNPDYGICLQTREVRAIDADITDQELAKAIEHHIRRYIHSDIIRRRSNSTKFLIPFIVKGEMPKRVIKTQHGLIEFLANGQQFVAIGTHSSGVRYEGLENVDAFPELSIADFEKLWLALAQEFAIEPPTTGTLRKPPAEGFTCHDPVASYLEEHGHVTGYHKEGTLFIRCPFAHEHSTPDSDDGTATAYLPAGGRDYQQGHFACLHAHCASRDDADFLDAIGYRLADFDIIPPDVEEIKKAKSRLDGFDVIHAGDYINRPPVEWLIKNILPRRELTQFFGGSGAGKTFVVLDMMLAICRGGEWNGHKINPGRVVYICAEGAGGFISRLKAYAHHHNVDLKNIPFGIIPNTPNFRDVNDVKAIAEKVKAFGQVDAVVVDTLIQVIPGADENAGKDMSLAHKHCYLLIELTRATCVLVAHAGKDASRGVRGWSGQKGDLAAQFEITVKEDGKHLFWVDKMKDGRDHFGYDFILKTVTYDIDTDGDALDSCIVEYDKGAVGKTKRPKASPRRKNETLVYEAFISFGGGEVTLPALTEEVLRRMPPASGSRDKRRQRLADALESLADKGELRYFNGVVSAPL